MKDPRPSTPSTKPHTVAPDPTERHRTCSILPHLPDTPSNIRTCTSCSVLNNVVCTTTCSCGPWTYPQLPERKISHVCWQLHPPVWHARHVRIDAEYSMCKRECGRCSGRCECRTSGHMDSKVAVFAEFSRGDGNVEGVERFMVSCSAREEEDKETCFDACSSCMLHCTCPTPLFIPPATPDPLRELQSIPYTEVMGPGKRRCRLSLYAYQAFKDRIGLISTHCTHCEKWEKASMRYCLEMCDCEME